MIKYLGSKRLLVPNILEAVESMLPAAAGGTVLDLFAGTSRVGIALKNAGYTVSSNDYTEYAYAVAQCYVAADRAKYLWDASELINTLSGAPAMPSGHFTKNYSKEAWFFQEHNSRRIEAVRSRLEDLNIKDPILKAIAMTSLLEAADRVDSNCGIHMAYLKQWSSRSFNKLELRVPELTDGCGKATNLEALDCLKNSPKIDLVYLDPPYNQHSYLSNYNIWETIVKWDSPETYGKARKRIECKTKKSEWNRTRGALPAFRKLLANLPANRAVISYSNKGFISMAQMKRSFDDYDYNYKIKEITHPAYIGHKIGRHSPKGALLGKSKGSTVSEFLFLCERKVQI
jgi:adenine-specific DNA-methyltransferase